MARAAAPMFRGFLGRTITTTRDDSGDDLLAGATWDCHLGRAIFEFAESPPLFTALT
jgi:hypothetical protein